MKRAFALLAAALLLAACARGRYGDSLLSLAVNGGAELLCSCAFVSGQSDESCQEYGWVTQLPKAFTSYKIDRAAKEARVRSLLFWNGRARWVDERSGCRLD